MQDVPLERGLEAGAEVAVAGAADKGGKYVVMNTKVKQKQKRQQQQ